jgi:hypothetical protein
VKSPSNIALLLIVCILIFIRLYFLKHESQPEMNVLSWDAFGYYIYLPGQFIYHDLFKLDWLPGILEKYHSTSDLYQITRFPDGNAVIRYPPGIAILYAPFFLLGHLYALFSDYPKDGFSLPYRFSICAAALFYSALGLWILRRVLLRFYTETVTSVTLILIALATNYPQYISVESGMTHGYLFTMTALMLYTTIRWHERPTLKMAFFIGLILGICAVARPTDAVILFIPLLWNTHNKAARREKWRILFRSPQKHYLLVGAGLLLAVIPQLLYWKLASGHWVYDVGSKFTFFRPHWQVLTGWEKGWFIYTPVTILMVAGLAFLRKYPFQKAVITYVLINTWIIIAWADWRYGASYSARALIQSYPALALAMGALATRVDKSWFRWVGLGVAGFLVYLNLFQIWQFNSSILHYNDNTKVYYQAVFLKSHPTAMDMSLMDTDESISNEGDFQSVNIIRLDSTFKINVVQNAQSVLLDRDLPTWNDPQREHWLKITTELLSAYGAFQSSLVVEATSHQQVKQVKCRLNTGLCKNMVWSPIGLYFKLPDGDEPIKLRIYAETKVQEDIFLKNTVVELLRKK